tara:strand:+ start:889 stop:1293 length:405 start_codon:yes stop_codon:yes gene_type:complete
MTKSTTITIVSLLFIGMVSVIMYHQLNAQEVVVIEPTYIQEEVLYEPPPLDTTPDYDIIEPSTSFGSAFAQARYEGNDSTFFWNGDEYHTRTVEEELERILKEEFLTTLANSENTPDPVVEVIEVESVIIDSTK